MRSTQRIRLTTGIMRTSNPCFIPPTSPEVGFFVLGPLGLVPTQERNPTTQGDTMKVISVGTKNQVTCTNCGSVLQVEPSDIQLVHRPLAIGHDEIETMPEPEDHYVGQVKCPVCGTTNTVATTRELRRTRIAANRRAEQDI
jgi:ribosomal protein S27E